MTSFPSFAAPLRVVVPIVAFVAFLISSRSPDPAAGPSRQRGDGWSIVRAERGGAIAESDGKGAILRHGDSFRLADEENAEHRITRLRFVLERLGESGFADLRFRSLPDVAHELKIARATSFGVTLLHVPRDAPRSRLAAASGDDPIPRMLTPFEFVVEFEAGRIVATVNGAEVFACADDREQDGAVELFARAEPLRIHSATIEGTRRGEPYRRDVDFRDLRGDSALLPLLRAAGAWALGFVLLGVWLHALLGAERSLAACFSKAAFPGTLPLAVVALAACGLGAPISRTLLAVAWLLGAIFARIGLARIGHARDASARGESPSLVSRLARIATVIAAAVAIGAGGSRRELSLLEPARVALRATAQDPTPNPFLHAAATTLDAGNAILSDGPYRDFDLRATLTLVPDSVLEVRLHGQRSDGVVFVMSASDRCATRFVRATPMEFESISPRRDRVPDSRRIELEIHARADSYLAKIDGAEVASASERLFPSGSIGLLAARGRVVVERVEIAPVPAGPRDDGAARDAAIGAARPLLTLLALAVVASFLLRRDFLGVAVSATLASLPFAATLDEIGRGAAQGAAAIGLPVFFLVALAFDHLQRAKRTTPLRLNLSLLCGVVVAALQHSELTRREWPPLEEELNALTCLDVDASAPLSPELLHFEHPLFRRWNFYLADHRFRKRTFPTARTPGRARVLALGTSSTYGYGANEDWPTILEQELRSPAFGARNVEVINAGTPGSTSWRLLYFLEHNLLRFDPDVLVISFYYNDSVALSQFDERAELARLVDGGVNPLRELLVTRMLDAGGKRFRRLDLDFRAAEFDAVARWDVQGLTPPPVRFEAVIRDYAELCRARGIGLVLLQEPISGDRRRIWKDEFRAAFRRVGADYGAPVVDPSAAQVEGGADKLFMDEVHPYVEGHRITAKLLAPVVAGVLDARKN